MNIFVAEHSKHRVQCIFLSPDEKTFVSISGSAMMYVCESKTGYCILGSFELRHLGLSHFGFDACFSPDGKHILVGHHYFAVQ